MDDRYRSSLQAGSGGYGRASPGLRYDSTVSSGAHYSTRLATTNGSSTDTLRNLSAQLQGMISETNTMRGAPESGARTYNMPAASPYQASSSSSQPHALRDTAYALPHRPAIASALTARSSLTSVDRAAYREPTVTTEDRPSSSLQVASLHEQIKLHKQTIDNLINEKTALEQSAAKLELLVNEKEGDCSLAVQHIDQVKKQNEELAASFGEVERKCHQHTQVIGEKDQDIARLTATLQRVKQQCEGAMQEKSELENQVESQDRAYAELLTAHEALQQNLQVVEAQAGELASQRDSSTQYADLFREKLTQQVSSLSEEIASLHGQLEQKDVAAGQLHLQLAELQGSEEERVAANERRIEHLTSRLTEEKETLQQSLSSEMEKNRNIHQQVVKHKDRINDLENQLSHTGSQASTALRTVRQELEKERERLQDAGQEKDSLRRQLQVLHKEFTDLSTVHEQVKVGVQSRGSESKELENQLQEKVALLRHVQGELLQNREGVEAINRENTSLREQLQHMQTAAATAQQVSAVTSSPPSPPNGLPAESETAAAEKIRTLQQTAQHLQADRDHILSEFHRHSQVYQTHIAGLKSELASISQSATNLASGQPSAAAPPPSVATHSDTSAGSTGSSGDDATDAGGRVAADVCPSCAAVKQSFESNKTTLQQLQARFSDVITEKADLVQSLQTMEHRLVQLEVETDTIGEYVSVYRSQREELLSQFGEKRKLISWLQSERSDVVSLLHQLNDWAHYSATAATTTTSSSSSSSGTRKLAAAVHPVQNGGAVTTNGHRHVWAQAGNDAETLDSATNELLQRLIEVIFYLCQGDPASNSADVSHTQSPVATPDNPRSPSEAANAVAHRTPGKAVSAVAHRTPSKVTAVAQRMLASPVTPSRAASAEHFVVPHSTVHSDIYTI